MMNSLFRIDPREHVAAIASREVRTLVVLLLLAVAACDRSSSRPERTDSEQSGGEKSSAAHDATAVTPPSIPMRLGGYSFVAASAATGWTTEGRCASVRYRSDDWKLYVLDGHLFGNGKAYGEVAAGDTIALSEGMLRVNGTVRVGHLLDEQWQQVVRLSEAPLQRLGPYRFGVLPGMDSAQFQIIQDGPQYEVLTNDFMVVVKNDELFVNEATYGDVNDGDTIVVDHGKIFVCGQERNVVTRDAP